MTHYKVFGPESDISSSLHLHAYSTSGILDSLSLHAIRVIALRVGGADTDNGEGASLQHTGELSLSGHNG